MSTILDLSEYTNLAVGTVSKYLNGGKVRPENRILLDDAIEKLNYRVNFAARMLKRQRSNIIGVVLSEASLVGRGNMLVALDRTLLLKGYSMILSVYTDEKSERDKIRLLSGYTDGLVILAKDTGGDEIASICEGMPVVVLDCIFPNLMLNYVVMDYSGAAYHASKYLLSRRHRRLGAILGGQNDYVISETKIGILRAFQDKQKVPDEQLLLCGEISYNLGYESFRQLRLIEDPPTAIIVNDTQLLMGAETAELEMECTLIHDVEIFYLCDQSKYYIPNRKSPMAEFAGSSMGVAAAELVIEHLEDAASTKPIVRYIEATFNLDDKTLAQYVRV